MSSRVCKKVFVLGQCSFDAIFNGGKAMLLQCQVWSQYFCGSHCQSLLDNSFICICPLNDF